MAATVATVAYLGLEARAVEVQVQLSAGLPAFIIVGLPDKAVAESRERVRASLAAIGLALPPKRITINLSPADLPKEGSHYDLPIALCLLAAIGATDAETLSHYLAVGELCLDGRIAASPGVLLAAIHASSLDKGLICPAAQGSEASWAGELDVIAAPDLLALLAHLKGTALVPAPSAAEAEPPDGGPDLAQVKGQEVAARTLFATHYHELTSLADLLPRVRNAHVAVREDGAEVVFEHRIVPGPSDRSYGIHVARLAGLPGAVVSRAEHLLTELESREGGLQARPSENGHTLQPALFGGPSPSDKALAALDIDGLTPIEAIQKLYELRALVSPRPAR
jgi:hypothetical protein